MQSSNFVFCFMCTYETGYIKYTQISPSVNMNWTKIHNFFIYHCFCNSILFSETVTSLFRLMSGYIGLFRTFCRIAAITFLPPCIVKSAICNVLRRISPFLFIFSAWQNLLPQLLFFPYCSKRFFIVHLNSIHSAVGLIFRSHTAKMHPVQGLIEYLFFPSLN